MRSYKRPRGKEVEALVPSQTAGSEFRDDTFVTLMTACVSPLNCKAPIRQQHCTGGEVRIRRGGKSCRLAGCVFKGNS